MTSVLVSFKNIVYIFRFASPRLKSFNNSHHNIIFYFIKTLNSNPYCWPLRSYLISLFHKRHWLSPSSWMAASASHLRAFAPAVPSAHSALPLLAVRPLLRILQTSSQMLLAKRDLTWSPHHLIILYHSHLILDSSYKSTIILFCLQHCLTPPLHTTTPCLVFCIWHSAQCLMLSGCLWITWS